LNVPGTVKRLLMSRTAKQQATLGGNTKHGFRLARDVHNKKLKWC